MDKKQHIAIFTTASLPWLTGTSVNPLFRAAYLAKDDKWKVTLVIPWLKLEDQHHVYSNKITFNSTSEQETYVRQWLEVRTGFSSSFTIRFYPGRVSQAIIYMIRKINVHLHSLKMCALTIVISLFVGSVFDINSLLACLGSTGSSCIVWITEFHFLHCSAVRTLFRTLTV